jgi:hypothetical protein
VVTAVAVAIRLVRVVVVVVAVVVPMAAMAAMSIRVRREGHRRPECADHNRDHDNEPLQASSHFDDPPFDPCSAAP